MIAISRPRHRWRLGAWRERLNDDLAVLRAWVDAGPVDVYLVGGLGLAVRGEAFYRNHADIDLAVFTEQLPAFSAYLDRCGYHWAQPLLSLPVSPWHRVDLARPMRDPAGTQSLRVTRGSSAGLHRTARRTEFMDVMLMRRLDVGVEMVGHGALVPWEDFLPATTVADSSRLWLPNVSYKQHLPARWPRQRRDLRVCATV